MRDHIKTLLLCALPASGKSETRKFLGSLSAEVLRDVYKIAETVQLDDYPYVDMFRSIDDVLQGLGMERMFFEASDKGFTNAYDWGTLMELINEDYLDLINKPTKPVVESPTQWMLARLDAARAKVGIKARLADLPAEAQAKLCAELDAKNQTLLDEKYDNIPETLEDKTVVIEFARGGAHGSEFPLEAPMGYQYSFSVLCPELLKSAACLYIWVTPEMSRAKNVARAQEKAGDAATSANLSLNHGVPHSVMMNDYGVDDIDYLLKTSGVSDAVKVTSTQDNKDYIIPLGRFDNRTDLTTFARGPRAEWAEEDVAKIRDEMVNAFSGLTERYVKME